MADPGQGVLHRRCLRHRREQREVVQLGRKDNVYAHTRVLTQPSGFALS